MSSRDWKCEELRSRSLISFLACEGQFKRPKPYPASTSSQLILTKKMFCSSSSSIVRTSLELFFLKNAQDVRSLLQIPCSHSQVCWERSHLQSLTHTKKTWTVDYLNRKEFFGILHGCGSKFFGQKELLNFERRWLSRSEKF